jgi:site-specific DNA-methyltransferase (adenine-specific)
VNLPDGAHLILTDPPYNVAYQGNTKEGLTIQNDDMEDEEFCEFLEAAFTNADNYLQEGGAFYVWHSSRAQKEFEIAIPWTVRQQLIWNKNSMVLGRQDYQWKHEPCFYGWKEGKPHKWYGDRKQTTVLDFEKPTRNGEHPTMKPVSLIAYQIENSTQKGDTVLDIFGGSGTTLIASEQLGRKCRMLELDEKYADVIVRRYEKLTGVKGIKVC